MSDLPELKKLEEVVLDGKKVSKERLEEAKQSCTKGMKIIETSPGQYKTRIQG